MNNTIRIILASIMSISVASFIGLLIYGCRRGTGELPTPNYRIPPPPDPRIRPEVPSFMAQGRRLKTMNNQIENNYTYHAPTAATDL